MTYSELVQKIRDYTEVSSTVLTDAILDTTIKCELNNLKMEIKLNFQLC